MPNPQPLPLLAPSISCLMLLGILHRDSLPYPAYQRMGTTSSASQRDLRNNLTDGHSLAVCGPKELRHSSPSDQRDLMLRGHLLQMTLPSLDFPTHNSISPIISRFNSSDGASQNSKHIQLYFWVCQRQRDFYQCPHLTGELQRHRLHKLWCNRSRPHQLL